MEFLASVAQIVACSVPIAVIGAWVSSRGTSGMRGLVSPWRSDPWPVGVQEEDPDAPWGHGKATGTEPLVEVSAALAASSPAIEDLPAEAANLARPEVSRLRGSVHRPH